MWLYFLPLFVLFSSVGSIFSLNFDNNVCKRYSDYLTIYSNRNCWFNPDVKSLTDTMIIRNGYPLETYDLTTKDGYIIRLYRIPHNNRNIEMKRQPVFIQHGLLMDSAIWTHIGNRSLAYNLAELGYDVWLGNFRGTRQSMGHVNMTWQQRKYWDFSYHEMGLYDLPTMLNFVADKTRMAGKIVYIGHSMGTTSFFIYSSRLPDEAKKNIVGMIALAPVVFLTHIYEQSPLVRAIFPLIYAAYAFADRIGIKAVGDSTGFLQNTVLQQLCEIFPAQYRFCSLVTFLSVGFDVRQLMPQDIPLLLNHATVAGSTKSSLHYAQWVFSGRFEEYSYGRRQNMRIYGSQIPPQYDLKNVKVPIYLLHGLRDVLSTPSDAQRLFATLETKKEIEHIAVDNSVKFNHIDFMFAKNVKEALYTTMFGIINRDLKRDVD